MLSSWKTCGLLAIVLVMAGCSGKTSPNAATNGIDVPEGISLLEEITRTGDEVVIPYRKYRLDNGLTVVLHQDNSDPLVHVDVTYHVGSGREDIGKSGFAHFFEHMMFQGSVNVADEQHFKLITEAGGTLNGTTNQDRTNYFETVPRNQLEKMLWLEADRMGFLVPAVTQEKFEVQRETVKNERGQRVDNAPYGLLNERVGEAMYPEGHPYSWSTIGYIEDLNRADVNDLKRFFLRWYGPNNATLTIGGDFDESQTLAWVNKYFGSIPTGPAVASPKPTPVTLDADRYISLEDKVALPLVYMAWPTVHGRHPDEAPLDVLMNILGVGRTSLLYKNLVRDGVAVQAQAGHGCSELHCQFTLFALPNPRSGKNLADIEKVLRDSLVEFETRGVLDDDLQRVKMGIVSGMIYGLESVSSKVSTLAFYETFTGNANYIQSDIARYEGVTKEDVVRVYEKYIKGQPAVIMSIVPEGQTDQIAHEDTWERYERTIPEGPEDEGALALREPKDDFDRSQQPGASAGNPSLKLPPIWRGTVRNGVQVLGAVNDETPTTAIQLRLAVGQRHESLDKLGVASLAASLLNEATTDSTVEELSNRLDKLGSSIWVGSDDRTTTVTVRALSKNLDETLAIAAEKLLRPKLDPADFERVKGQTLQSIEMAKTNAGTTASDAIRKLLYGKNNAFAHPDQGTAASAASLTLDDVKAFITTHYTADRLSVLVVSDLPAERVTAGLEAALDGLWDRTSTEAPALETPPPLEPGTLYFIDKPDAPQSEIRVGRRAIARDFTGEFFKLTLMNHGLAGNFNSRLNLNLREDKGYTYGARGSFLGDPDTGRYTMATAVRADSTAASLTEFRKELASYAAEGPTADEVAFMKASIGQRDAREYETPQQKLNFLSNILEYSLPDDFVEAQKRILAEVTEADLDKLAAERLSGPNDMIWVVVGDKKSLLPQIEELGFSIKELSPEGDPL